MIVYVEYVVIDNLVIDYLLLSATFTLTGKHVKKRWLLLSALLGSGFALLYPLISVNTIIMNIIKVLFGLFMLLVCAKWQSLKSFYLHALIFFAYAFLIGGAILGVYSIFELTLGSDWVVMVTLIPVYALIKGFSLFVNYLYRRKNVVALVYKTKMTLFNKSVSAVGFMDTGNGLYYKDIPVIICSKKFFLKHFGKSMPTKFCLVEVNTINGKTKHPVFVLEEFWIYYKDNPNRYNNVALCVSSQGECIDYDLILHPALIGEVNGDESVKFTKKVG